MIWAVSVDEGLSAYLHIMFMVCRLLKEHNNDSVA